MNEEEDVLRRMALATPTEALDRRIAQLLKETPVRRSWHFSWRVPLWQCGVACLVCAAVAFLAGTLIRGRETATRAVSETRWIIQIKERPFDVFDWTTYPREAAPRSAMKAVYTVVESAGGDAAQQGLVLPHSNEAQL